MKRPTKCILDWHDGRRLALLCKTPRTTESLRNQYDFWVSQYAYGPSPSLDFYMERLEKEGLLEYIAGKWHVTNKALEYIMGNDL